MKLSQKIGVQRCYLIRPVKFADSRNSETWDLNLLKNVVPSQSYCILKLQAITVCALTLISGGIRDGANCNLYSPKLKNLKTVT